MIADLDDKVIKLPFRVNCEWHQSLTSGKQWASRRPESDVQSPSGHYANIFLFVVIDGKIDRDISGILYQHDVFKPSSLTSTHVRYSMDTYLTVYLKKYAHGFVVLCFVVVMQSFVMNSHEVFIHIHQGCFAGTGSIVRLQQCQWSKPDGYGKISQCITTPKHSKAKTVCIFLGIYCTSSSTNASSMRPWIGSALVQIMACRLVRAKPLSEPVLEYC